MRHARLVYFVAAVLGSGLEASPILAQDAERQVAQGKAIYARRCAKCHGADGQGKMGPSLIGAKHHLSGYGTADVLFDYTRQVMPAPVRMNWAIPSGSSTPRCAGQSRHIAADSHAVSTASRVE